jgi:hypothetical protein
MEEKGGNGSTGKEAYGTDERGVYVIGGSVKGGKSLPTRHWRNIVRGGLRRLIRKNCDLAYNTVPGGQP